MADQLDRRLPDAVVIPPVLIEAWGERGVDEPIPVELTRRDWDNIYVTLDKSMLSQVALQQCLIDWSNGRNEDANRALVESQRQLVESQNALRQLFISVMAAAMAATHRGE